MRILIVEDETSKRRAMERGLTEAGNACTAADEEGLTRRPRRRVRRDDRLTAEIAQMNSVP